MFEQYILQISRQAFMLILILSAPPLFVALVLGLFISIIQAVTQIQDQNITFVPKIIAVFTILGAMGYWLLTQITRFSYILFDTFSRFIG